MQIHIHRPKKCESTAKTLLVDQAYDVTIDAFGETWLPKDAITERAGEADMLIAAYEHGRMIAYSAMDVIDVRLAAGNVCKVIYNASTMRRRELQNKGLGLTLLEQATDLLLGEIGPEAILMARTQNPAYHRAWLQICAKNDRRPYPDGDRVPGSIREIASAFGDVDDALVMRNVYWNRSLMPDTPRPREGLETALWNNIDVAAGDALMLVAPPTYRSAQ
jgi:hypothetical protein